MENGAPQGCAVLNTPSLTSSIRLSLLDVECFTSLIAVNREEIVRRCRAKAEGRSGPPLTEAEIAQEVPGIPGPISNQLRLGLTSAPEISKTAILHGHEVSLQGFTLSDVVHDYADVCQAITELAVEPARPSAPMTFAC